jgi:DNA repair/transcription protein MET18/MMS19
MPLLLRGLDLADFDIRADVIDILIAVAEDETIGHTVISEHTSSLVTAMLKNSLATEMSSTVSRWSFMTTFAEEEYMPASSHGSLALLRNFTEHTAV